MCNIEICSFSLELVNFQRLGQGDAISGNVDELQFLLSIEQFLVMDGKEDIIFCWENDARWVLKVFIRRDDEHLDNKNK